jgi:hypothetical protein
MYVAALILTILGWAVQAYETLIKKTRNINIVLPLAYFAACILFGVNNYLAGDIVSTILDAVSAILAAVVFIVLFTKK